MSFDAHKNFSYSTVATAPSPASSGTSLVVQAGDGALFPAAPFNATVWPSGVQPSSTNGEVVRVTAKSTDTFTITRTQESSSARSIVVGDQIASTITAKTLTDVEKAAGTLNTVAASGASQTINYSTANNWDITLTANCTFTLSGATSGDPDTLTLILRQDATGSRTVTWPTITWAGGAAPVLQTAASAVDFVTLTTVDGGSTWFGWYESGGGPGYEIGYDQITATVNVTSTTESAGTTVLSASAHSFDGGPVVAEFFSPLVRPDSTAAGHTLTICLFEGSTEIGRLALVQTDSSSSAQFCPVIGKYRFTPSAGSHTYTVTAFLNTAGTGQVQAGAAGTGAYIPAFLRFTKV